MCSRAIGGKACNRCEQTSQSRHALYDSCGGGILGGGEAALLLLCCLAVSYGSLSRSCLLLGGEDRRSRNQESPSKEPVRSVMM